MKKPKIRPRKPPSDAESFVRHGHRAATREEPARSSVVVQRVDGRMLRRINVYLPQEVARALMVHCAQNDMAQSDAITAAVTAWLKENAA